MATTATIEFSNEKRTSAFKYTNGTYVIQGSSAAAFSTGALESASGTIMEGTTNVGNFHANRSGENLSVGLVGVNFTYLSSVSTIVTDCLAKIAEHYV